MTCKCYPVLAVDLDAYNLVNTCHEDELQIISVVLSYLFTYLLVLEQNVQSLLKVLCY